MLPAVTKAVSGSIPNIAVYNERPTQNAPKEYLFVSQINREQTPDNGRFFNRFYFFDIRYHPNDKVMTQYKRFTQIIEELTEALTYIETEDQPVKASTMRSEIQDGVLHFFVDYPVRVIRQKAPVPNMEELELEENIKERE